jgi:hypothetical protein
MSIAGASWPQAQEVYVAKRHSPSLAVTIPMMPTPPHVEHTLPTPLFRDALVSAVPCTLQALQQRPKMKGCCEPHLDAYIVRIMWFNAICCVNGISALRLARGCSALFRSRLIKMSFDQDGGATWPTSRLLHSRLCIMLNGASTHCSPRRPPAGAFC